MSAPMRIALVGTPNVGKSTLFNELTGLSQKVGNFPGVTVDPLVGSISSDNQQLELIDLPGIYSLDAVSEDEQLTIDVLTGRHKAISRPDAVLLVMNAQNPEKCLVLFSHLAQLGLPLMVVVTMVDSVKLSGGVFDDITLFHELGVNIYPVVGRKGLGVTEVRMALSNGAWKLPKVPEIEGTSLEDRFAWSRAVVAKVLISGSADVLRTRIDGVVLHPVWGTLLFLGVMAFFFQAIFSWAQPMMDGIDTFIASMQEAVEHQSINPTLRSFLSKGLLSGVGSVVVFLPQILLLNLLVVLLEESGYLARAAFLVDRAMGLFGLQGRSFIPLLGSFACAIPGIMSARIIPSYRDRLVTIMATPLMTCSARLPVYALIISALIPAGTIGGVFSLQAAVMAGLYALGAISGLLIALVLKKTMFKGAVIPFLIEFPPYRAPSLKSLWVTVYGRTKDFLTTAGTVILGFSIALWILTELPQTDRSSAASAVEADRVQIEQSYAAAIGKAIQPVFAPLGFDWRITLGVLSSFTARETFVSSMGQIYAADVQESDVPLRNVLRSQYPLAVGLSILAFYVYALQCISTIAIMRRETGSWKWPSIAFAITFTLAYLASLTVYIIAS
ncbi:MAG: ferrous iron transporter B [Ignavibacteria bacterium]|nr:ferrous iron transporter B [Ignavibacteria bacterium]